MFVFLSPHFDDAIGSAGGVITRLVRDGHECIVMTVMARPPKITKLRSFIYVLHRIAENRRACRMVGANVVNGPFSDAPYRKVHAMRKKQTGTGGLFDCALDETGLVYKIRDFICSHTNASDILIAPAGLGDHIDHRLVRCAVEQCDRTVYFYEEFYYDTWDTDASVTRDYQPVLLTSDELDIKIRAMAKYKRTLRHLFRKKAMVKMQKYYRGFRVRDGFGYERFNSAGFLK